MINLLRLIYVNILGILNFNEIMVARNDGVKSSRENKVVIIFLSFLAYGYIVYSLLSSCHFSKSSDLFVTSMAMSIVTIFIYDLFSMGDVLFKENDLMLLSFPLNKGQIIVSKIFTMYLKNLAIVFILGIAAMVSYLDANALGEELLYIFFLIMLLVPIIPLVIAYFGTYFVNYIKIYHSKFMANVVKIIAFLLIIFLAYFIFGKISADSFVSLFNAFTNRLSVIYFPMFFIKRAFELDIISFVIFFLLNVGFIFIFLLGISNNYLKMGSILSGVKRKKTFIYKRCHNFRKFFGLVRKEFLNLVNNKVLFNNTVCVSAIISVLLTFLLSIIDVEVPKEMENFSLYVNYFASSLMCLLIVIGNFTGTSISLEKENYVLLSAFPIKKRQILGSKFFLSMIIGTFFALFNSVVVWYFLRPNLYVSVMNFLLPVGALCFNSLLGLFLDYRFKEEVNRKDSYIIKQRFMTMVPSFIAIFMALSPILFSFYGEYKYLLVAYLLIYLLLSLFLLIYFVFYMKREEKRKYKVE